MVFDTDGNCVHRSSSRRNLGELAVLSSGWMAVTTARQTKGNDMQILGIIVFVLFAFFGVLGVGLAGLWSGGIY